MKKILTAIALVIALMTGNVVLGEEPATAFVHKLADEVITNVLKSKDTDAKKMERFEKYFLTALDTQNIGKFVLGRYWKTNSASDRDDFITAFTDMALKSWADKFNLYRGQEITFTGERPAEGKNQVYVDSQIQHDPNPIQVIWRVRKTDAGDYKIMDIVIEGVSMALSYRNEYTAFLQNKSLPELTERLTQQAAAFEFTN